MLLLKGPQFAADEAAGMLPLTWNKPAVFLGFASKDFGELGSLLRAYPRLRPLQTAGRRSCDGSGGRTAAPPAFEQ
jgi:hypothetical protein